MSDLDWKSDLTPLLSPESIALIGASENSAWTSALAQSLKELGYRGKLYPVNPNRKEVFGIQCYPSVVDIPGAVDAFIIAISRDFIVPVLQDCAQKEIRAGVIISAGFAEASETGKAVQQQIVEIATEGKIRICGPNSFGVANLHQGVSLMSSSEVRYLKRAGCPWYFRAAACSMRLCWRRGIEAGGWVARSHPATKLC